ncbi:hypothetical protein [Pontibacter sp. G13]|uniref:hypothetical protein n=1 Tax=Pontibacter sp. G13 TaxID=3074898 RepID=UPI002889E4B3|nr:hypothetical protein [Pontibacter sp. G13]WNJ18805.1 hypothetical protein RJD25_28445 [Pontibacter sp. G13]
MAEIFHMRKIGEGEGATYEAYLSFVTFSPTHEPIIISTQKVIDPKVYFKEDGSFGIKGPIIFEETKEEQSAAEPINP